ncbi:MAG: WD40/YVTN/BNR-like repeat-containing protein [Gaiellaceae bacterium]
MTRVGLLVALSIATGAGLSAADAVGAEEVSVGSTVRMTVGPTRLLSPGFGYSVAYRTVERGTTVSTTIGLFIYEEGRWRNATPPALRADGIDAIDDVAFVDRRHGWVAAYNCARAAVYLYRTSDGGRSWQSLGEPAGHSCGGGPTFLSFIDQRDGWMEPVSPNGPAGALFRTADGGRIWKQLLSGPPGQVRPPALPCLAPIRFGSVLSGWMARCEHGGLFSTTDGGRRWSAVPVEIPDRSDARFDLPWLDGEFGVVAATVGTRPPTESGRTRAVTFSVSSNGGQTWTARSTRRTASCPLNAYYTASWPTSIVNRRVWWIVAGAARPVAQVTTDAGRTWRTVPARGLPARWCSIMGVNAAGPESAWVVAREGRDSSALFQTVDGGRDWRRVTLLGS